jgi:tetratricopeptide (TPR) repeat protein
LRLEAAFFVGDHMMHLAVALLALAFVAQSQDWKAWMEKGNNLSRAGNFSESLVAFREALAILDRSESGPIPLVSALNSLATAYADMDRPLEAEQYYRRALEVVEKAGGRHSVSRAQILVSLSGIYLVRKQFDLAEEKLREALALYADLVPPDSPVLAVARNCLGEVLRWQGSLEEAATLIDQALVVLKTDTTREGLYGTALNNKGAVRWAQGRRDEAILLFQQSLAALELDKGPLHPKLLYSLNNLAVAEFQARHMKEAAALFSRAVLIAETHLEPDNSLYGGILGNYANCLKKMGRKAEARNLADRASLVLKASERNTGTGFTVDISALRPK